MKYELVVSMEFVIVNTTQYTELIVPLNVTSRRLNHPSVIKGDVDDCSLKPNGPV